MRRGGSWCIEGMMACKRTTDGEVLQRGIVCGLKFQRLLKNRMTVKAQKNKWLRDVAMRARKEGHQDPELPKCKEIENQNVYEGSARESTQFPGLWTKCRGDAIDIWLYCMPGDELPGQRSSTKPSTIEKLTRVSYTILKTDGSRWRQATIPKVSRRITRVLRAR